MSKGIDRLEQLIERVRKACGLGSVEYQLIYDCMVLREDVLRAARELLEQESEPSILEAAEDFREVGHLLDRLIKDLMHYDFGEVEECLSDLQRCMRSAESHVES
ncbi:hypothetical protein JST97_38335 [bacterium]|nr:hypothetical protein [bacterium]